MRITEAELNTYMAKKALKKALKHAKRLKSHKVLQYSNHSNPFGDANLSETFVWRKKIERDIIIHGVPLDAYSLKAEKKRQRERMAEIENAKKRRVQRALEKAQHDEQMALLARKRAHAEFQDWEKKEEELHLEHHPLEQPLERESHTAEQEEDPEDAAEQHDKYRPKYSNHIHTRYEWNKYNRTHYDHDNLPPTVVQGYEFNIFYPDLVDKTKAPKFDILNDGNSSETCILRFQAGSPYEDIAFKIINKEWECSSKKGYKCTFDHGILRVHFNFKRYRYRR